MPSSIAWMQPDGAYRRDPGMAQSSLKAILISPAHYQAALKKRWPASANMVLGSALHCAVLEGPKAFEASYVEKPEDIKLTTKEGKAWAAEVKKAGKTVLNGEQTEQLKNMVRALGEIEWFAPERQADLRKYSELSIYWDWMGVDCKARLDRVIELEDKVLVLDLKTTDSVNHKKFLDKVVYLNYLFQAAYYTEAAAVAFNKPAEFVFVGVERDLPNCIDLFSPDADMMAEGRRQCEFALQTFKQCTLTEHWPGPAPTMNKMSLPSWFTSPVPCATMEADDEEPLF